MGMSVMLDVASSKAKLLPTFVRQRTVVDEGGMSVARSRALASRPDAVVSHIAWGVGPDSARAATAGEAAAGQAFVRSVHDALATLGPYRTAAAPRQAQQGTALLRAGTDGGSRPSSYVIPLKDLEQRAPGVLPAAAELEQAMRSVREPSEAMWRDFLSEARRALGPPHR